MVNKKKYVFIWLVILNTAAIFFAYLYRPTINEVNASKLKPSLSRYTFEPLRTIDFSKNQLSYPYVSKKPGTFTYSLLDYAEKYQLVTNQADYLFFADKRISELSKWGDELEIEGNTSNIDELLNGNFKYDSWEQVLRQYTNTMDFSVKKALALEVELFEDQDKFETERHLAVNRRDIQKVIKGLEKPNTQKEYLFQLTDIIFNKFEYQLGVLPVEKIKFNEREYNLGLIDINKDYGKYDIKINRSEIPESSISESPPTLRFDDRDNYYLFDKVSGNFLLKDIEISENQGGLILDVNLKNEIKTLAAINTPPEDCVSEFRVRGDFVNFYIIYLDTLYEENVFGLETEGNSKPTSIQLVSKKIDGCDMEVDFLPSEHSGDSLSFNFKPVESDVKEYYLAVYSNDQPIKVKENSPYIYKYLDPSILLIKSNNDWLPMLAYEKISKSEYQIELSRANMYQFNNFKKTINFPYKIKSQRILNGQKYVLEVKNSLVNYVVYSLLIIDITLFLITRRRELVILLQKFEQIYLKIVSKYSKAINKHKKVGQNIFYFSFIATIVISIVDTFYISSIIDPFYLVPLLLLFLLALVFDRSYKIFLVIGLSYILSSWLMYLLNIGNYIGGPLDKVDYWGYYFVLIGALLMIIKGKVSMDKK